MYREEWGKKRLGKKTREKTRDHLSIYFLSFSIVNRGKWLGRPVNIKEANKQAKIYVGRSLTLHIFVLCSETLLHKRNASVG